MNAPTLPETAAAAARPDEITPPPTQDELPYEDGIPMETARHRLQMELLIDALEPWLARRPGGGYVGGNMFLYFSLAQLRTQDFRGPDVFVALDAPPGERKSWVVWEEGKGPDVVIELLSSATAEHDKNRKKIQYQDQLKVGEYFWYDPFNPEDWAGFTLRNGRYESLRPDDKGRLISAQLDLALVRWHGLYRGVRTTWLRWAALDNGLLPTAEEIARRQAEQERQRAEQERRRAERLAAKLRALGVDPDAL